MGKGVGKGVRRKREKRLTLACGLPQDVLEGAARVTLYGSKSVMIEGQSGVVELGGERMRLRTKSGVLCVLGEGLVLRELTADAAMIVGTRIDTATYGRTDCGERGNMPCG